MDWTALTLSLELAAWTVAILLPVSVLAGRWLAVQRPVQRRPMGQQPATASQPNLSQFQINQQLHLYQFHIN